MRRILVFPFHIKRGSWSSFLRSGMCPKHRNIICWKEISGEDGWDASWSYHQPIVNIHSSNSILMYINCWLVQLLVNLWFYPFADSYVIIIFDIIPIHFLSHPIWTFLVFVFWPVTGASSRRGACTATPWCQVVASAPRNKKPLTFHYTGGLLGILTMVCFNPHIAGW